MPVDIEDDLKFDDSVKSISWDILFNIIKDDDSAESKLMLVMMQESLNLCKQSLYEYVNRNGFEDKEKIQKEIDEKIKNIKVSGIRHLPS